MANRATLGSAAQVDRFLRFVRGVDDRLWVNFLPELATGRAATSEGAFSSPAEHASFARMIADVIAAGGHRAAVLSDAFEQLIGCVGAGLRQLNVDIRGNVTACVSRASFGNIVDEPLATLLARARQPNTRLKRGFFCAAVNARAYARAGATHTGAVLDAEQTQRELAHFFATNDDALCQRALDVVARPLGWPAR